MEHDAVGVDRARDLRRVSQRGARLLVDLLVRSSEVDEVERVRDDVARRDLQLQTPLPDRVEVGRIVIRRVVLTVEILLAAPIVDLQFGENRFVIGCFLRG